MDGAAPASASLVVIREPAAAICPDLAAVQGAVNALTGREAVTRLDPTVPSPLQLVVELTAIEGGLRAAIALRGERSGHRELVDDDPTCRTLAEGLVVSIAILLDPAFAEPAPPAGTCPAPPPVRAPQPTAPPPLPVEVESPDDGAPPWRARLGPELGAGISLDLVGAASPFFGSGLTWRPVPRFGLALGAAHVFAQPASLGAGSVDVGLDFASLRASSAVLGRPERGALVLTLAALAGSLRGEGREFEAMHTERLPWFAAAFGVTSTGPVSDSLAWDVSLVGVVPLLRHAFVAELDGARADVFKTPAAGALFGLGLRWELLGS